MTPVPASSTANSPQALHRALQDAMARRDAREASVAADALLRTCPDYPPGWLTASALALDLGQPARALALVQEGLRVATGHPSLLVQYVRCLHAAGEYGAARQAAAAAVPQLAQSPRAQHELGNTLAALGDHATALALLDQAVLARPDDTTLRYNRATILRFLGRFAQAEDDLDRVIRAAPLDWEAYPLRSGLRRQTPERNHIDAIRRILFSAAVPWVGEVQLRYALAKEYEDLGQAEASFAELASGAAIRRTHLQYDVAADVAIMGQIAATFNAAWLRQAQPGDENGNPIFVFGLPRSGTTLVERIISSHPDVCGLGELNDFPASLLACAQRAGAHPPMRKQALVDLSARLDPSALGSAYLARLGKLAAVKPIITDKLPSNYLYAGLIAASLPRARLVAVKRHPMATGYAMFKTLFNQGYPFSYDLDELGHYIAAHARLMSHWSDILGPRLISVSYEALVADQEGQTRSLIASLGLAWNDACLSPHRNEAASLTQSAVQVRAPVHRDAVNQWRVHSTRLRKLASRLLAEGMTPAMLQ